MIPTPALISGRISARLGAVEHLLLVEVVRIAQNDHYTRHQEKSERVTDTPADSEPHSKPAAGWKGEGKTGPQLGAAGSCACAHPPFTAIVMSADMWSGPVRAWIAPINAPTPRLCRCAAATHIAAAAAPPGGGLAAGRSGSPGNNTL